MPEIAELGDPLVSARAPAGTGEILGNIEGFSTVKSCEEVLTTLTTIHHLPINCI
jgi:hypothetical protein